MIVKILGISGSPRRANTEILVKAALSEAENSGAEIEYVSLAGKIINPCKHCDLCPVDKSFCIQIDAMQEIYEKLLAADGIIIGSPVYVGSVTAQLKATMDRCRALDRKASKENKAKPLRLKVGGAIAVASGRHAGQEDVLHTIRTFFSHMDMIPVGITAPHTQLGATGITHRKDGVRKDEWFHWNIGKMINSIDMARMLGRKVFILTAIVKAGREITKLDFPRPYCLELSDTIV
ncbi:MAG: flavodoxin family protein [Candidatus Bathyarchaeota archaeon]|nr:MAG: flavodoxin family protein [Candidatus Bathyarchaeota archaeon]